jgi:Fe-S-cluster-containing dehydrogenase component
MACKDEFVMNDWPPYSESQERHGPRWMDIERKERGQFPKIDVSYLPKPCQHCADPPCAKDFPDVVSVREDGIVMFDIEKAKGQKGLADACPYGCVWYNGEKDVAQKCILCAHILDDEAGSWLNIPRCAHICPLRAIDFFEADDAEFAKKKADEGLQRYLPELSDDGAIWYKNLYRWTSSFIAGSLVKDGECAEGVAVGLKGAADAELVSNAYGDFCFDGLAPGNYTLVVDGKDVKEVNLDKSINIGDINI